MSNKDIFSFKQFKVFQGNTAMKVGTDGVLLGALTEPEDQKSILDIGAGTGLISLMLAQRSNAIIEAIEIDENAQLDCEYNFKESPWNDRLKLFNGSFQDFSISHPNKLFDLIVSNPPFFKNNSINGSRAVARSQESLSFQELISIASKHSHSNSQLTVIIPFLALEDFLSITANHKWFLMKRIDIRGNLKSDVSRTILFLTKRKSKTIHQELCIELNKRHEYSKEYKELLKDYLTIF